MLLLVRVAVAVGSEGSRDGVGRRTAAASSICNSIHVVKHGGRLAMGLVGSLLLRLVGKKLSDHVARLNREESLELVCLFATGVQKGESHEVKMSR